MKSYIDDIVVTDPNGEKAILYPHTKQEAVEGLSERLESVEKPDITETTETTMPNSFDGRFLFKRIKGVGEQGENPSPENPQEVENSVVSKIKSHGKNWIPYPYDMTTTTSAGMTFTDNEDGTIDVVGTATANTGFNCQSRIDTETPFILPKGTYRLTGCPSGGGSGKYLLMIQKTDPETGSALNFGSDSGSGVTVTLEEDCETTQINIFIYSGFSTTAPIVFKPMLVRVDDTGNIDNTWEPYKESVVTLSQPIELRRIEVTENDDYTYEKDGKYYVADTIEKIDGEYKKVERIPKRVFDGVNNVCGLVTSVKGATEQLVQMNLNNADALFIDSTRILCDRFKVVLYVASNLTAYTCRQGSNGACCCYLRESDGVTDIETANTWLQSNPVTVYYILAEPIITSLPLADQIALNSLETFDGITYLEFDSEIKPEFEGEYGTSKAGGYMLESLLTARNNDIRISSVEATVVNNI